ncbi:hypothetical protein JCGZ_22369 [Jatropha curcas]|uniref:Uncharacterized protein n=1 Tax=Jatropha curcas TaxID=180498 RepID=A0A067L5T0_JATCU|nr:hypothetical protein JCGZ_22369 [Jatropha curcas]
MYPNQGGYELFGRKLTGKACLKRRESPEKGVATVPKLQALSFQNRCSFSSSQSHILLPCVEYMFLEYSLAGFGGRRKEIEGEEGGGGGGGRATGEGEGRKEKERKRKEKKWAGLVRFEPARSDSACLKRRESPEKGVATVPKLQALSFQNRCSFSSSQSHILLPCVEYMFLEYSLAGFGGRRKEIEGEEGGGGGGGRATGEGEGRKEKERKRKEKKWAGLVRFEPARSDSVS